MPRNGSGSCSLAEAAFVPNTPISSADTNSNNDDIIEMLTDSLSRSGDGGMQAVLELDNSGFVYGTDPNTGMRRTAGDEQAIQCGGVDVIECTPTGATVNGDLEVTGDITIGGVALLPIGLGPLPWSGLTAPSKWILAAGQSLVRATYPDLWTFAAAEIAAGNTLWTNGNGTTTFTPPDMRGRVPAGKDNMGGSAASRLTATTMTPDGNTLGAVGGAQTVTLAAAQIPAGVPSSGNNSISVTSSISTILRATVHDNYTSVAGDAGPIQSVTNGSVTSVNAAQAIAVTSTNAGQTAVDKIQPTAITNYIIYAGA